MGKKSREKSSNKYVIDTSYLLPLVGIEVEGLDEETINKLFNLELHYPSALIPELVGVIIKEARKMKLKEIPKDAIEGFNSIVYGGFIKIIPSEGDDIKTIYKLFEMGCNDIFDAILYATSKRLNLKAISMDKSFKDFLKEHGFNFKVLVSHKDVI